MGSNPGLADPWPAPPLGSPPNTPPNSPPNPPPIGGSSRLSNPEEKHAALATTFCTRDYCKYHNPTGVSWSNAKRIDDRRPFFSGEGEPTEKAIEAERFSLGSSDSTSPGPSPGAQDAYPQAVEVSNTSQDWPKYHLEPSKPQPKDAVASSLGSENVPKANPKPAGNNTTNLAPAETHTLKPAIPSPPTTKAEVDRAKEAPRPRSNSKPDDTKNIKPESTQEGTKKGYRAKRPIVALPRIPQIKAGTTKEAPTSTNAVHSEPKTKLEVAKPENTLQTPGKSNEKVQTTKEAATSHKTEPQGTKSKTSPQSSRESNGKTYTTKEASASVHRPGTGSEGVKPETDTQTPRKPSDVPHTKEASTPVHKPKIKPEGTKPKVVPQTLQKSNEKAYTTKEASVSVHKPGTGSEDVKPKTTLQTPRKSSEKEQTTKEVSAPVHKSETKPEGLRSKVVPQTPQKSNEKAYTTKEAPASVHKPKTGSESAKSKTAPQPPENSGEKVHTTKEGPASVHKPKTESESIKPKTAPQKYNEKADTTKEASTFHPKTTAILGNGKGNKLTPEKSSVEPRVNRTKANVKARVAPALPTAKPKVKTTSKEVRTTTDSAIPQKKTELDDKPDSTKVKDEPPAGPEYKTKKKGAKTTKRLTIIPAVPIMKATIAPTSITFVTNKTPTSTTYVTSKVEQEAPVSKAKIKAAAIQHAKARAEKQQHFRGSINGGIGMAAVVCFLYLLVLML